MAVKDVLSYTQAIDCILDRAIEFEQAAHESASVGIETGAQYFLRLAEEELSFACTIEHLARRKDHEKAAQLLSDHGIHV